MLGNLQVFLGPEVYNHYAEAAKSNPVVLYGARSVLLVALVTHVVLVVQLYRRTLTARPIGYRAKQKQAVSEAKAAEFIEACTKKTPRSRIECALSAADLEGVTKCDEAK